MSSKRLDSLSDYCRAGYNLRIDCACGHTVLADPHALMLEVHKRDWRPSMEGLAMNLKCNKCGARPSRLGPALGI